MASGVFLSSWGLTRFLGLSVFTVLVAIELDGGADDGLLAAVDAAAGVRVADGSGRAGTGAAAGEGQGENAERGGQQTAETHEAPRGQTLAFGLAWAQEYCCMSPVDKEFLM